MNPGFSKDSTVKRKQTKQTTNQNNKTVFVFSMYCGNIINLLWIGVTTGLRWRADSDWNILGKSCWSHNYMNSSICSKISNIMLPNSAFSKMSTSAMRKSI